MNENFIKKKFLIQTVSDFSLCPRIKNQMLINLKILTLHQNKSQNNNQEKILI